MNQPLLDVIMNGLAAGRPRDALAALTASRLPIADASGPLVLAAAEALAAVGHERRALALLTVATRTHTDDRSLAVACARASLARGHHLRAQRVLEPHVASTGLLMSVARREPLPPVASALDVDDEIDRAMATATTTAALTALLERAPSSARLRIGIAMRLRHEGQNDEGRGLLRAGLKGREDARLEVALAAAAVQDEVWDEAAMVIARARARHPALGRSAALRLVLAAVAVGAGKTDDAISIIHGASGLQPAEQALLKLLKLPPVAPFSTVVSSSPPPTTDTAPSATSVASPPAPSTVTSLAHDAPQSQWRGPVAPPDEPAEKGSPWVWLAFAVVLVGGTAALVLPKFLGAPAAPPDVGVVAVVDAGIGLLDAGVPPTAPTAFSIAARGCGIPFDSWADGAGPLSHLSELAAAQGWQGRNATVSTSPVPIDEAVLASATLLTIRTGGRVEPAIVLGADRTPRGFAYVSIVATNRATVSDVITIADVHFDDVTASPCPAANPVQRCARARVVCDGLAISLQALCPADDTTLAAMPSCEFDIVTVTSPKEAALVPAPTPDGGADGGVAPIPSVDAGVVDVGSVDAGAAPEPETAK